MIRKTIYRLMALLALTVFFSLPLPLYAESNESGVEIAWNYKGNLGPSRWGELDSHFMLCATGRSQSPINIIAKKYDKTDYKLTVNYKQAPLVLMDNGDTELMIGKVETVVNTGHGIQVDFNKNSDESMNYDGNTYRLVQFHFHSPSENLWHGQSFPLEIHFVHQGENGKVLAMGVFVKAGEENPVLANIINHLPDEVGKEKIIAGEKINPDTLLPSNKAYYSFMGSLTTPPCTEGFQWIVMANAITASPAQIVRLRQAMGGANARPIQALNDRPIFFAEPKNAER